MLPHPADDHGCSIVAIFRIKHKTVEMLKMNEGAWPASLRLFRDFVRGGTTDLPNPGPRKCGLLKAIATCKNVDEVAEGIPAVLKRQALRQNGKPTLITQSGQVFRDPAGEWLEVSIDVRRFCFAAREAPSRHTVMALRQLRDRLGKASVHIGFLIQGTGEDCPEGIVCDARLHCLDIMKDPVEVV